jgi:hypothetical protein
MTTLLLFGFSQQEEAAWKKSLEKAQGLRLLFVPQAAFGTKIQDILAGKQPPVLGYGQPLSQRMLLLCDAPSQMIHFLLALCKQITQEPVLRAVLTETNRTWTPAQLHQHLLEEEAQLKQGRG